MGEESVNKDIFDKFTHLIAAALFAFALTYGLGLLSLFTYYTVIRVIFYAAGIIILIETFRRDRYTCIGYLIGIIIGTLLYRIAFGLPELLIYFFILVFELYRLRTGPRA